MKTIEPTIDFSWDRLNFPGSKFKGFLFQRFVYPQVELFRSKLGSCMAGFSEVRWCPKLRIFFAFPGPQNWDHILLILICMYIYTHILKFLWTVGASMAFFSHDSLKED